MKKISSDSVYEPQEDSLLMAEQVKKYAFGDVLDLGCGSGIQGIQALKNKRVNAVYFVDINPKALDKARESLHESNDEDLHNDKDTYFIRSDLFENLDNKRFDTIVFNPPYLPDDKLDNEKIITTGGTHGYELILRFLSEAKKFLKDDGIIILLFSSLSNKKVIDEYLKKESYTKNLIVKKSLFMEVLYVYILKIKIDETKIFRGHRGIVELNIIKGKKIATKHALKDNYNAIKEAKFLKILNKYGIGPKYISNNEKSLSMEYIEGARIIDYFLDKKTDKECILRVIKYILEQLLVMDGLQINKLELTNPYKHIIIEKNTVHPIMIDFERCYFNEKPKNITQFIQFLCSERMRHVLSEKNMRVDKQELRSIAKNYKMIKMQEKNKNKKIIMDIIQCFT